LWEIKDKRCSERKFMWPDMRALRPATLMGEAAGLAITGTFEKNVAGERS
jgi:hypothetical protein